MFNVRLFEHSKRENSTKQPSGSGTSFSCKLKQPCGVVNPRLEFNIGLTTPPSNYNYCYIPSFNRYYWIEDWINNGALWIAQLQVDVLASYKHVIGDSDLYILRSASTYNGDIVDVMYPFKSTVQTNTLTTNSAWSYGGTDLVMGNGTFVIQIAGEGVNQVVGMNATQLTNMISALSNDFVSSTNLFNEYDASFSLQKSLIDPFQFITACVWIPVAYATIPSGATRTGLTIGGIEFPSLSYKLLPSSYPIESVTSFTIPTHPQSSTRGRYMNVYATQHRLYIPPFGMINLDSNLASKYRYVLARYDVDCLTGNGKCLVGYTNNAPTYGNIQLVETVLSTKLGVDIQISQQFKSTMDNVLTASGTGWNMIADKMSDAFGKGFASTLGGIFTAMGKGKLDVKGSMEGFVYLRDNPRLETEFMIAVDDDITMCGRPLCEIRKPKNLSGYMLVQDGDVQTNATSIELSKIKNYLESGFYYE